MRFGTPLNFLPENLPRIRSETSTQTVFRVAENEVQIPCRETMRCTNLPWEFSNFHGEYSRRESSPASDAILSYVLLSWPEAKRVLVEGRACEQVKRRTNLHSTVRTHNIRGGIHGFSSKPGRVAELLFSELAATRSCSSADRLQQ